MLDETRVALVDLENVLGSIRVRPRVLRARVGALLDAMGRVHHIAAGYGLLDSEDDPVASVLAEMGMAPLRVAPGPDAAESVLLAHAHRVHVSLGCRTFVVASADRRFATLAELGRLDVVVFSDQPISARLIDAAHQVHKIPRPDAAVIQPHTDEPPDTTTDALSDPPPGDCPPQRRSEHPLLNRAFGVLVTGILSGLGIAIGQRLTDAILRGFRRGSAEK